MERINLTTPEQVKPGTPRYELVAIVKNFETGTLHVQLRGANGEVRVIEKTNVLAQLHALNKANLSVKSEHRRLLEWFISDGDLAGNIAGTPD